MPLCYFDIIYFEHLCVFELRRYATANDGQPVWDPVAWAGNTIVWNSVLMGVPWASRVAAEADATEAKVKSAFGLE